MSSGIKENGRPDLALVVSDRPARAAALSTANRFKAASLLVSLEHLRRGEKRAVLINSGNANCLNGRAGLEMTRRLVAELAAALQVPVEEVLFASTGKIGLLLPESKITGALPSLLAGLGDHGHAAAEAIMTTDRVAKEYRFETGLAGRTGPVRLGGMAKGVGMIRPELATMIAVITTDAAIEASALRQALKESVQESFNMLTVDEDQSTNDFVLVLANGAAGNPRIKAGTPAYAVFRDALRDCCVDLTRQLAADGEGAEKLIVVKVGGAWSLRDARRIARRIAGSSLVKSMISGSNPNWGRVLAAAGSCAARIRPEKVRLDLAGVPVFAAGEKIAGDPAELRNRLEKKEIMIELDLGLGAFSATAYGCDLTEEYVRINQEYS